MVDKKLLVFSVIAATIVFFAVGIYQLNQSKYTPKKDFTTTAYVYAPSRAPETTTLKPLDGYFPGRSTQSESKYVFDDDDDYDNPYYDFDDDYNYDY